MTEERKERIKYKLFNTRYGKPNAEYYMNRAYLKYRGGLFHNEIKALTDAECLDNLPAYIDEDDLIAGRYPLIEETPPEIQEEAEQLRKRCEGRGQLSGLGSSNTGHRVIDYEKLLSMGINGVLNEVAELEKVIDFYDPEAAEKRSFCRSSRTALESVLRFTEKYKLEADRLLDSEADPKRRSELLRISEALKHVPAGPANTFFEAIQSMWLIQFILGASVDISLTGRPDNYLYPYYISDIQNQQTDDETVMELIEDLYFKHNMLYGAWPASIMVGGVDRQGNPKWNELSYMFIRAIETTGLVNPSVAVCYNESMPDDLLALCLDVIAKGYTRPSIFNDDLIIKGLLDAGVTLEDARYYIHSTCVEITPIAASNIQVATPYINLNKGLEYLFNEGKKIYGNDFPLWKPVDFSINDLDTFEKFYQRVKEIITQILKQALAGVQDWSLFRERYCSSPLASCFLNDCMEKGKDSGAGGARYDFVYPCFPGFLNLTDSLAAIKKAVYDEKITTLNELSEAMKSNFDGYERLRAYLMNKCPKFGNDIEESDSITSDLFLYIKDELKKFRISVGGTFHPSYFAWIMHGVLGEQGAATPDGRRQAEALSECLGSVQGMDRNGPLALMRSVSKVDQMYGIGGIATNFRFSKKLMKNNIAAVREFVREFMNMGNFEMQFNVVDQQTLLDAQKHPENYRTLLVRVAGYSEYFVNLPPVIQNEVIKRLEHDEF